MAEKKRTTTISLEELVTEALRAKAQIKALSDELDKPELELAASVRLNAQRRELEAYLTGLLYALGESPPWPG